MKPNLFMVLVLALFLNGCQPGVPFVPSPTQTPTILETPTSTIAPTSTPIPVVTLPPGFLADPSTACIFDPYEALTCLDQNGWHVYDLKDRQSLLYGLSAIGVCNDGRIYIADTESIYRLDGDVLIDLHDDTSQAVYEITCGPKNDIWTVGDFSLSHYNGSEWQQFDIKKISAGKSDFFYGLSIAPDGSAWVSTPAGVLSYDGRNWQMNDGYLKLEPNANLYPIVTDSDGVLWGTGSYKLFRYDGVQWSAFDLSYYQVYCMAVDRQNKIWMGSDFGLLVFNPAAGKVENGYFEEVKCSNRDSAIQFDQQGRLWVASDYGFDVYDGSNAWIAFHRLSPDLISNIHRMVVLGDGVRSSALIPKVYIRVRGKLLHLDTSPAAGTVLKLCGSEVKDRYYGDNPCGAPLLNFETSTQADGSFEFAEVPVGSYYLLIQESRNSWFVMKKFDVDPGAGTQLGVIHFP